MARTPVARPFPGLSEPAPQVHLSEDDLADAKRLGIEVWTPGQWSYIAETRRLAWPRIAAAFSGGR